MKRWIARLGAAVLLPALFLSSVAFFPLAEETPAPEPDPFEALLDEEKFPESYRPGLRALHEQYPNWVFKAQHTGLSWQTVLDAESRVGVNLVPSGSIASWKSCDRGAYDLQSGRWYGLDGDAWVAASREIVAYCLDPRNALTPTAVFQFENLAYSDVCVADGVAAILAGTFMGNSTYVGIFMEAGKLAGVSPYHLASRARQEQGVSGNALGRGTASGYAGYYNFFNINAYATSTLSAIQNGARYAATTNAAYYLPWNSPERSIKGGAVILGSSYISRGQNTLYLQKFDVTDGGNGFYTHQYMTNVLAPTSEAATLSTAYSDAVKSGAMEFCIPVYEDMPDTACPKPTSTGCNDNWLSSLTVAGQTLTPTFSLYETAYELVVTKDVTSITAAAKAHHTGATVGGTGVIPLAAGINTITVSVTAPSGAVRCYTISVYRPPSETGQDAEPPVLTSETYRLEQRITGVSPDTPAETFLAAVSTDNEEARLAVVTAEGAPVTGSVGTGCTLQVIVGDALCLTLPVVVRGDVSGDGVINSLDLLKIQKQILGVSALNEQALLAADANNDGAVNALDLLRTQKHILKLATIAQ